MVEVMACERVLFGGAGLAKLLGRLRDVCAPMGVSA